MQLKKFECEWGGKNLIIETGKFAGLADAAVTVQYGDTVILATAVMSTKQREGVDFLPLMVDYEERLYAAGKIKGSRFIKREGRPSDESILTSRLVDRSIRPLFSYSIRNDIQVVLTLLSHDQENDPDILSLVGASAALAISPIPWNGPIAGIRVGRINGEWIINPSYEARTKSDLDLVVSGTADRVLMLECQAQEIVESVFAEAVEFGQKHYKKILDLILQMQKEVGLAKNELPAPSTEEVEKLNTLKEKVRAFIIPKLDDILFYKAGDSKATKSENLKKSKADLDELLKTDNDISKEDRQKGLSIVDEIIEEESRKSVLESERRVDNRTINEIRSLSSSVGILPRTHGSGLFQRGETQVLSIVTLGSPSEEQILDGMEETTHKRYMHHYNFPGFSVGEAKPMRSTGRREIGHGALAEKALMPVLPSKEEFPYTIRVVSEVLASNGSSSMGATCGSTLSLMDAGVTIKKPVSGIAMGLIYDEASGRYKVLTDLQGVEDFGGDMDFKVAGTRDGITAVQLDVKISGLTDQMVRETIDRAKIARLKVLDVMDEAIKAPRPVVSQYAPKITVVKIKPEKIRDVIGAGGKIINEIIAATGANIDIEQDGTVFVSAVSQESVDKAAEWVKNLTREAVVGEIFEGKVMRIMDFGAFVEILPKQEGLVHISELAPYRVNKVTDILQEGDTVKVKLIEVDSMGRLNLSRRQAMSPEELRAVSDRPMVEEKRGGQDRRHFHRRQED